MPTIQIAQEPIVLWKTQTHSHTQTLQHILKASRIPPDCYWSHKYLSNSRKWVLKVFLNAVNTLCGSVQIMQMIEFSLKFCSRRLSFRQGSLLNWWHLIPTSVKASSVLILGPATLVVRALVQWCSKNCTREFVRVCISAFPSFCLSLPPNTRAQVVCTFLYTAAGGVRCAECCSYIE